MKKGDCPANEQDVEASRSTRCAESCAASIPCVERIDSGRDELSIRESTQKIAVRVCGLEA